MAVPATADDVVERVAALAGAAPGSTLWVGIDGRGATGKTTLAGLVVARVEPAAVVHVDDFSGPAQPTWDRVRFAEQVVTPLRAGRPARYQVWNWDTDRPGAWREVAPGSVVVVEGVSATAADVPVDWSLRVWVDAPVEVRLRRALARDGEAMMPVWTDRWMPSEEAYIADERPDERADLVVSGDLPVS